MKDQINKLVPKLAQVVALAAAVGLSIGSVQSAGAAGIPESNDPIKLAVNEWTGQHISTHVAGELLKKMGYNVAYVTAGYYPQMTALQDNTVSATLEIWSSNIGEHYEKAMATGKVEELGDLGLAPVETWYFNDAAKAKCAGLPDWKALANCTEVFASAETFPNGRLVDYPADWGTTNVNRIKGFKLPYTSVPAGSEGALVAEIKGAEAKKQPLLVMFWSPHWVHAVSNLHAVKLPPFQKGCNEDTKVSVNADTTWDCDWERGYIKKLAWKGLQAKWPGAHAFLKAYQLRNQDQIPMMNAIDQQGQKLEAVVKTWIDANQSQWQPWIAAAQQ